MRDHRNLPGCTSVVVLSRSWRRWSSKKVRGEDGKLPSLLILAASQGASHVSSKRVQAHEDVLHAPSTIMIGDLRSLCVRGGSCVYFHGPRLSRQIFATWWRYP